ncbi:CdaR family protein [Armatimonas rosea]|uniref:YbbR domain-containing protein n=1 Tax=Armatimonas rosea TaxID=685828 RepID=A0A7W9SRS4_ARMRO|nr:CdaR family protein [Armatimonas rosea]MBB6051657.1 YbbR domain-containing protein [Armatimonas rosea]
MIALLRRNWEYKLLSLVLSILLFVIASVQRNPSRTSSMTVQPDVIGVPADLAVKVPPRVEQVTLTGTTEDLELVRKQGIQVRVNANGAAAGKNALPVGYELPKAVRGRVSIEAPPMLEVELEARIERSVPVRVLFENQPPPGFEYETPQATPEQVTVTGLASDVAQVERVVALLDNTGASGAVRREVPVVAQDKNQQVVSRVNLKPTRVEVALLLRQAPATKTLVLSAALSGSSAPGVRLTGYQFAPSTIVVRGEPTTLSKLSSLLVPVSLSGLATAETRKVSLTPPPGTVFAGPRDVQLTLSVEGATGPPPTPTASPNPPVPPKG